MLEPVHVLFFVDELCHGGGAERMLLNTIRLLPADRFRCSLITFRINTGVELFARLPCPHHVFPLRRTYDWNAVQTARRIRKLIREENVKIVHTFHETSDLWAGLVTRMTGGPVLVSSRRDMGILRQAKHKLAYRLFSSRYDLVLTVSEQVRRFCIERDHLSSYKVATIYNGLELNNFTLSERSGNVKENLGLGPRTQLILTLGHVRRVKGIDVLVETAAKVTRECPDVIFLVIGRNSEPEYFREIEARITQLGLESKIRFLGESEKPILFLTDADAFFLPSRSEGFSNALIEAMACALPCVATRVGGNPEAVDEGRSGYLVESEDADAAADRLLRLLRNPAGAKKMGATGRRIVERRFTAEVMIQKLVSHYERLLASSWN